MVKAKRLEQWQHTSSIMALIANCNRDPKKKNRPFQPRDFNPYMQKKNVLRLPKKEAFSILKTVFIDRDKKKVEALLNANRK